MAAPAPQHTQGSDAGPGRSVASGGVVYVVDDDALVTTSLGTALRLETEYDIRTFGSAADALAAVAEAPPDVVITDFKMPGMDGLAFLAAVRAREPEAVLILLTGYADKDSAVRAINQLGIFQYLEKPWSTDDLLITIRNAMERRALVRDLRHANEELRREADEVRRSLAELERAHAEIGAAHARLVQSERLAAVGRLAAGLAHEVGNQLALLGYAEAIKARAAGDPAITEFADQIKATQRRLTSMLDEIRDFARGGERYALEPASVAEVVEEALSVLRYDAEVRGRRLERQLRDRPLARLNRGKLAQVVINLVRNAAQATGAGGAITVAVTDSPDGPRITVADDGVGMSSEVLGRLGEPFFTTRDNGAGLGWGIVRRIVQEHGGSLEVTSTVGAGTTVTVALPPLAPEARG